MLELSIVILTKNEAKNIARCLKSVHGLTNDIIVVDSGSNDQTIEIATSFGAKVIQEVWQGYSTTKNIGNGKAAFDWILSLDADEELNEELRHDILNIFSTKLDKQIAFTIKRKMVYCGQTLHYGSVSNEFRIRIFNRKVGKWNTNAVHEDLVFSEAVVIKKLTGFVWHHSYSNKNEHLERLEKYAQLSARQMLKSSKKVSFLKLYLSPVFGFIKNYFFKLGFMDGKLGYQFALNEMWYVKRKYELLKQLN